MSNELEEAWEEYRKRVHPVSCFAHGMQNKSVEEARAAFAAEWGAHREYQKKEMKKLGDLMKQVDKQQNAMREPIRPICRGCGAPPSLPHKPGCAYA